jgi:sialic acid synthase SpsE
MSQIVLDMGSGNTCQNDKIIIEKMIRAVADADTGKHEIILKWQLFESAIPNIPLTYKSFEYAYKLAMNLCLKTTASVFDISSMRFLMGFNVPFVKIACREELYYLSKYSTVPVYISTANGAIELPDCIKLACVPKYPATIEEYESHFTKKELRRISDHTVGWRMFNKYRPEIIEKHFVHVREPGNPDAGPFAVVPSGLKDIL